MDKDKCMPDWYLLYRGCSDDGMGSPSYFGRTLDKSVAVNFLKQNEEYPQSLDCVEVCSGNTKKQYRKSNLLEKHKRKAV